MLALVLQTNVAGVCMLWARPSRNPCMLAFPHGSPEPVMSCLQALQRSYMRTCTLLARRQVPSVQGLAYPFSKAVTALRQFAHARHVGKILLHLPEPEPLSGRGACRAQVSSRTDL